MKQYKGYYIDNVIFNSKEEIDNFIKEEAKKRYIMLNQYFLKHPSIEAAAVCSDQMRYMHNDLGFSYEELEAIEIQAIA